MHSSTAAERRATRELLLARARSMLVRVLSHDAGVARSRRWLVGAVLEPGRLPPMTPAIVAATLARLVLEGTLVRTVGAKRQTYYRLALVNHARVLDEVGS